MNKCQYNLCNCDAKYELRLSIAVSKAHEPAITTPVLLLCEEHKACLTFEDMADLKNSDGVTNWDSLCAGIEASGRMRPVRKFCKCILTPLKTIQLNASSN